ncbi:TIGR03086 family metal-binding protein [Kitasatospora sp. A2-31]|uniref:TIGR03086 family metal-binding protein n=1 Tax=Kitasatospora sp. A2-31 TaxID=2916414 RepID=UPI001EEA578C|nr:TIGR03086 family metal-binding protein [Kitasatospora sp. A2-31]MCG6494172.1 TIGR03086 family metal-binding protein [Kitasatospora sp. A2-31]
MSVDGFKLLAEAHEYLLAAVRGVPEQAWGARTPCSEWTVRQILHHARLDQQALVMQITGEPPAGDPFEPEDALASDGRAAAAQLETVLSAAMKAWESVREAESVPTPMGPMPADVGTAVAALDAAVHAWDIARATGQDLPLTESMAERLETPARQTVDFVRDNFGKYGPAVDVPAEAGRTDRLLAFTGRDPQWRPGSA